MSRPETSTVPSVLVALVVRDGAAWLRECLQGLGAQTHARLGVLAVDNGSRDESREILEQALGVGRVLSLPERRGVAASVRAALETPAASEADYLLVLHDDTSLAPDAVERMIEAAERLGRQGRVGVVGPKVVDWDDERILREVGRSTDRFGHPTTPLQDEEMDHGQYDRVREVLFVSSCAMLVSREAWQRAGAPDERLDHREDLDFCWRVRLAGFRVLVTPLALARHRDASARGERVDEARLRGSRYYGERAAIAAMLKNYGIVSLAWLLPLYSALGVGRVTLLALVRRFEEALELVAAWTWNLVHLPGTVIRRVRAQSVRAVRDRAIRVFMEPAGARVPRWLEAAGRIIDEQRGLDEDERLHVGRHARSLARAHPVLVAWALAVVVAVIAHRKLLGPEVLQGGALPVFPGSAGAFFGEFVDGVRTTGLGGDIAASPALMVLGALSWVSLGSTALAQKVMVIGLPGLAGITMYRSALRLSGDRAAAVLASVAYSLSALMLWAFSEGRIGLLVGLAVLPVLADRLESAFTARRSERSVRLVVGAGAALALGLSFAPELLLGAALLLAVHVIASPRRVRGLLLVTGAAAVGAALAFPMIPGIVRVPSAALWSAVGTTRFDELLRLSPGAAPGAWVSAWFLPAAAFLSFVVVAREHRWRAVRAAIAAVGGLFLSWSAAAGYLPAALTNPSVYLAVAAVAQALLVGLGAASVLSLGREAFGLRQVAGGALWLVLLAGGVLQIAAVVPGTWGMGAGVPPAWSVAASGAPPDVRVIWVGAANGQRFPAPAGDPEGIVEAGASSVRYAITSLEGASALDVGRWESRAGLRYVERVLTELVAGDSRHVGAMLSPLSVRFVVAPEGDLPAGVLERLAGQVDLDVMPTEGLAIYGNAVTVPTAAAMASGSFSEDALEGDLTAVAEAAPTKVRDLAPTDGGWSGNAAVDGIAFVGLEHDPHLRLVSGGEAAPGRRAFGWANAFEVARGEVEIAREARDGQIGIAVLGILWLAALWLTRRPAAR